MQTIQVKSAPEIKQLLASVMPSYKKHNVFLSEFHPISINSYWDGGSRNTYILVNLADRKTQLLPTSTHPYLDVASKGMQGEDEFVSVDNRGNITLKQLPEGFALIEAGTFCGKPATAHIFLNSANMTKMLPSQVSADQTSQSA